ncbi:DUF1345 domain-containing protein [soil metagenome]
MSPLIHHLSIRPRLVWAVVAGLAAGFAFPGDIGALNRALIGWDVAVWLYLVLVGTMMLRADHHQLRRHVAEQGESATTVLSIVTIACVVSLAAVVFELAAAKSSGASNAWPHLLIAFATVVGSWLLLPVAFAQAYASLYYRTERGEGLQFPGANQGFRVEYHDFLYFSFTLAVACQTSDVTITSQLMRRYVLLQSVLSFLFNTAILAFSINVAAGMF